MTSFGISYRAVAAVFAAIVLLYGLTLPGNTVESIDGYDYAFAAENVSLANSHDTRSILFHKINRVFYLAADAVVPGVRAYTVLRWGSVLAGAGAVILFARLMIVGFAMPAAPAWLGAGLLAASYGFWRYALEVEVYAPSTFLILATLNIILDAERASAGRLMGLVPAGIFGGFTALYYQPNAIPLFLAMPVLLLSPRSFWRFVAYGAAGTAIVVAGLCIAYAFRETAPLSLTTLLTFINDRGSEFPAPRTSLWSAGQAGLSVSHDIVSSHWLYGFDSVTQWLAARIPKRFYRFEDAIYAAEHAPRLVRLALITFIALCATAAIVIVRGWRRAAPIANFRLLLFFGAWFALHFIVAVKLDPSTEEAWIISVTPLAALFTALVLAPAWASGARALVIGLVALLFVQNYTGGIGLYQNADHERRRLLFSYLAPIAKLGDVLVAASDENSEWVHARYRLGMEVVRVEGAMARTYRVDPHTNVVQPAEQFLQAAAKAGKQIYAFERAFDPGPRLLVREDETAVRNAAIFRAQWLPRASSVISTPFGRIYKIIP
jgi:hypothetical protein